MNFYLDGLTAEQIQVLQILSPWMTQHQFYLAGGTALAIYLRHRRSVDLDWFTPEPMPDALSLAQTLRDAEIPFITERIAPGTLYGQIQGVRTSLMEYRYPLLGPLVYWQETRTHLASMNDLACMKLSAIAQRGSKKDFYDVYALCSQHRPLAELLELYLQKFNVTDISPVLYGLTYFDDAEQERDPLLLWELDWPQVKRAFRSWVKEII